MSELYLFERGDDKWTYTRGLDAVSFGGDTYTPEVISYGRVEISNDVFRTDLNLSISIGADVVTEAFNVFSTNYCMLKIYRDESLWWVGRVTAVTIGGGVAKLKCESVYNSIGRLGVKDRFERICRHTHYGAACGLNKEDYKYGPYEITDITNNLITIDPDYPGPWSDMKYGMIYNSIDYITIVSKTAAVCKVVNILSLEVGQSVYLYMGCQRGPTSCIFKFDNFINYGGFNFIPSSNVFEVGIV